MGSYERSVGRYQQPTRVHHVTDAAVPYGGIQHTIMDGQSMGRSDRAGIKDKIGAFIRRKRVNRAPSSGADLSQGTTQKAHNNDLHEYLRTPENEMPEAMRPIRPEDVQTMIDEGWFENWDRIKGLKGDVINEDTVPSTWNDETREKFRDEVLMPFYFPKGPIHIVAKDEKGNLIREVDVNRQSFVFEWTGKSGTKKLLAARSFIDKEPWASEVDFNNPKFKMAHAQMLVVAPGEEDAGSGTGLGAYFHKEVFDNQGFTHIITWVNMEGIDYGLQELFFKKMGYKEDRKQKGLITINPTVPDKKIEMRKYWLTPKKVNENMATENNIWLRWERKKHKRQLAEVTEERQNSSR